LSSKNALTKTAIHSLLSCQSDKLSISEKQMLYFELMQEDNNNQNHDINIKELIDVKEADSYIEQIPGISMCSTINGEENNNIENINFNDVKLNDMLNESELSNVDNKIDKFKDNNSNSE